MKRDDKFRAWRAHLVHEAGSIAQAAKAIGYSRSYVWQALKGRQVGRGPDAVIQLLVDKFGEPDGNRRVA